MKVKHNFCIERTKLTKMQQTLTFEAYINVQFFFKVVLLQNGEIDLNFRLCNDYKPLNAKIYLSAS